MNDTIEKVEQEVVEEIDPDEVDHLIHYPCMKGFPFKHLVTSPCGHKTEVPSPVKGRAKCKACMDTLGLVVECLDCGREVHW